MPRATQRTIPELLDAERGEVRSAFGRLGVALVFPNSYYVGMSNLAVHSLYRAINAHPEFWCDRAFVWPDGRPVALETGRSLADFDVVALSLSYELDEMAAVELLKRAGIAPLAADRDERAPVIICGGVAATLNPEPLAPIADLLLLGEVETTLPLLLDAIADARDRNALFDGAQTVEGCYVPSRTGAPPSAACVQDLDAHPTASAIITPHTEFADRFLVEISRGCTRGCRFCATRGLYGRARMRSADAVLDAVRGGMALTDLVGLVGATIVDHPDAVRLYGELRAMGAKVSVSSFQADGVSDALLECLAAGGQRTVTIAPETGSERLRRTLAKGVSDADVVRCAEMSRRHGMRFVKLYFMIGLPGETEEDLAAVAELVGTTAGILPTKVTLTPFVPKPFTPLAEAAVPPRAELQRRLRGLSRTMRRARNVTVTTGSVGEAQVETWLSHAGREAAAVLLEGRDAVRAAAARYCRQRSAR
ncbi:MAG: radical SAM protein [Verrucomicrobia bacterium]|nr:radical SAM protein [Verrucomicrobiota bacterium]